jgi:hypothetical protein
MHAAVQTPSLRLTNRIALLHVNCRKVFVSRGHGDTFETSEKLDLNPEIQSIRSAHGRPVRQFVQAVEGARQLELLQMFFVAGHCLNSRCKLASSWTTCCCIHSEPRKRHRLEDFARAEIFGTVIKQNEAAQLRRHGAGKLLEANMLASNCRFPITASSPLPGQMFVIQISCVS